MASAGVVAVEPSKCVEAGRALAGPARAALERRRLKAALKDSASALSALDPVAPMLCLTPADLQA